MSSNISVLKSGYDLPVYGLANGLFYYLHIPAILCIVTSFVCAVIAIVLSFRAQSYHSFFVKWSKSERFVVYLALCDGLFNMSHFTDHMHIMIVKDHVYPRQLCEFYGFILAEFVTAQNLLVNFVAINAFILIYFDKHLDFGRWDWRLLAWTFGAPFVGATIAAAAGKLGTTGAFCYFDAVKGKIANICFTTVPLTLIVVMNTVLYILIWKRIHDQSLRVMSTKMHVAHRAAKAMSLFVAAFFIQWWALALYGVWALIGDVPEALLHLTTTFSNLGGMFNLCVLIIMRRKGFPRPKQSSNENRTPNDTHDVDLTGRKDSFSPHDHDSSTTSDAFALS